MTKQDFTQLLFEKKQRLIIEDQVKPGQLNVAAKYLVEQELRTVLIELPDQFVEAASDFLKVG